jgi:hypothetical protein
MDILRDLAAWTRATDVERDAAARRCLDVLGPGWAFLRIERPIRRAAPCPRCRGTGKTETRPCAFCSGAGSSRVEAGLPAALFSRRGSAPFLLLPGRDGSAPLLAATEAVEGFRRPTPAEWARILEPTDPTLGHLFGLAGGPERAVMDVDLPPDPVPPGDLSVLASETAWILRGKEEVVDALRRYAAREGVELVEIRPSPLTFEPCPCEGSGREIEWEHGEAFLHYESEDRPSEVPCSVCHGSGSYWEERRAPVGVYRRDGKLFALRPGDPPALDVL